MFQKIKIMNNPVRHISPRCLRGIHVKNLFISHGLLKQAPSLTPIRASVMAVRFNYNEITDVSDDYFDNCIKLEMVAFTGNMLQRLPYLFPVALTLQKMHFSYNLISDVTSLKMTPFPKLQTIDLESNQIANFVLHSDTLPKLEILKLAYNRLTEIDELYMTVSAFRVPVSQIFISHNSWNCSHVYAWVAKSMHNQGKMEPPYKRASSSIEFLWSPSNASKTAMYDIHKTFCSSPPALVNCSIMDIGKSR